MNKEELIKKLNEWDKIKIIKRDNKEIVVFENEETFKLFGQEKDGVLNPFNNYTYKWLDSFFLNLRDYLESNDGDLEELIENFRDDMHEYIFTDIYTSDLTEWLNDNENNVYYLTDVLEEMDIKDGFKLLEIAQYKAIEELYFNALNIIEKII